MSAGNSTAPALSGKPAKPRPDFPRIAHPAGYWCKKIKGKLHYLGRWNDPDGALRAYQAFLAGKPWKERDHTPVDQPARPSKPYDEYPLTAHPIGQWCKMIRRKLHYFGVWSDPDAAPQEVPGGK